ncbi:MAG: tail fiber protein [Spirochaetales bacterium]|nr:tail fiber protein [Spirochaetales bacterium]
MKRLFEENGENIRQFMRKSYHNRRITTETGADFPTLIRSVDNGFSPIKYPTSTEGITGERIIDLPEIPYRASSIDMPILLFRGGYPTDGNGDYITAPMVLAQSENRLKEGIDYILSGSRERPTAVKLLTFAVGDWLDDNGQYKDIHYCYYGLGSVLSATDLYNFWTKNFIASVAEITRLAVAELFADEVNFSDLIRVNDGKCEVHDTTEIGTIKMWGVANSLPKNLEGGSNYLLCDGSLITKTDYPLLFDAWGITTATTRLPNFIGRFPVGCGVIKDEYGKEFRFHQRENGGEWEHIITKDEMPKHSHNLVVGRHDGDGTWKDTAFLTPGTDWDTQRDVRETGGSQPMSLIPAYCAVAFIVRVK